MKKIIVSLTVLLSLVFSTAVVGGGYMVYWQLTNNNIGAISKSSPSEVKVESGKDSNSIQITTALPGLVIFVFGSTGLILLLVKIPVQDVMKSSPIDYGFGYKGRGPRRLDYPTPDIHEYNELMNRNNLNAVRKYSVPLPVWWLLKLTNSELVKANA